MTAINLTLGESTISCRGTSSDANQTIAGLAESGGSVEVDCYLDTAKTMGECTAGQQLMPMYANGSYALGAQITTDDGNTRQSLATQQVTLNNTGHVVVAHSVKGKSVVDAGNTVYGGPSGDGNMNAFSACPVSFKGTTVGGLTLSTNNNLKFGTGKDAKTSMTFKAAPFTAMVYADGNKAIGATGEVEVTVTNSGAIMDGGGVTVTSEFRTGDPASTKAYFDFAPPTTEAVKIGTGAKAAVIATKHYSGVATNKITAAATDMGVGVDGMARISVGDCTVNKFNKAGKRGAFVPLAGYENVTLVSQLAEEDAAMATGTATDSNGNDCYVAQVTAVADKLGNAKVIGTTSATAMQSLAFGVDKTAPVISDIEFDASKAFNANATIKFEIDNPKLASGDDGTAVVQGDATVTIPDGKDADKDPDPAGSVTFNLASDDDATATVNLTADGTHTVTVTVKDKAEPANTASFTRTLTLDRTDPTFSGSGPSGTVTGGQTAALAVSGVVKDATAGLKDYTLSVRDNTTNSARSDFFCEIADPVIDSTRVKSVTVKGANAKSLDIGRTLSLKRPSGAGAMTGDQAEKMCVLLTATDAAGSGNMKHFSVATFSVEWSAVAAVVIGSLDGTARIAEQDSSQVFTVSLSQRPTDTVTVAIGGTSGLVKVDTDGGNTEAVATAPLKFTPANHSEAQTVRILVGADDNVKSEDVSLTTTASGGGYDGVTGTPVKVTVDDNDIALQIDDVSIMEGAVDTVTITATRGDTLGTNAVNLTVNYTPGQNGGSPVTGDSEFSTAPGSSTEGASATAITIPSNKRTASIKVAITAAQETGTVDKLDDSILVWLSDGGLGSSGGNVVAGSGNTLTTEGDNTGILITIVDDDKT